MTNIKTLVSNNTHLADLFTRFTGDPCSHSAKTEATCTTPNICKNCDLVSGSALGHADGAEDADTECDGCGKELSDYKEFDATELGHKINTNNVYASQGTVLGRNNVYGAVFNGTDVEVVAKTTASTRLYEDSVFGSWAEVRNNFKKKGYQYIAIDFALSEGAAITLMGSIPPAISGGASITSGLKFTAGQSLAWSSMVDTDKQKAYFSVYSEGAQINIGDTIEANKWYTVVVKLLTDVTGFKEGESSYSSVAFGLGNNKKVYFSGVRYYTNDTYMIDYLDYTEMNATEFVSYKPSTEYLTRQGNVFGRTNIYGAILSDWNVEVVPKNTVPSEIRGNQNVVYKTGSVHADWAAVRKNYETQGYQYIAMDFALSEGAKVSTIGCVPPAVQGGSVTTIGLLFADGKPLAWNKEDYTDEQKSYFVAVYSEGKQVNIDDTIEANKWYTVVIKLLVDGGKYSQGEHGWANVSFNAGNGNMVYFSNVRYYRNETFKTDFAG